MSIAGTCDCQLVQSDFGRVTSKSINDSPGGRSSVVRADTNCPKALRSPSPQSPVKDQTSARRSFLEM